MARHAQQGSSPTELLGLLRGRDRAAVADAVWLSSIVLGEPAVSQRSE
jgi:hypothetical protein